MIQDLKPLHNVNV